MGGMFEAIDKDRSGFIEEGELTQALTQMGYRFSPTFIQNLLLKYDQKTKRMTLDNFIVASVQIKRLTDSFRSRDREMQEVQLLFMKTSSGLPWEPTARTILSFLHAELLLDTNMFLYFFGSVVRPIFHYLNTVIPRKPQSEATRYNEKDCTQDQSIYLPISKDVI